MMLAMQLALRSIARNWRHSTASVLSITLGFLAISSIQGYYEDCMHQFSDSYVNRTMTGHIIVDRRSEEAPLLNEEEIASLQKALDELGDKITQKVRFLAVEGIVAGSGPSFAFAGLGYDVAQGESVRGEKWSWNALYGRPLDTKIEPQVVIGAGLAELLGCPMGDLKPELKEDGSFKPNPVQLDCLGPSFQLSALTEKGQMNAIDSTIRGIVDAGMRDLEDSWIMMPLEQAQLLLNTRKLTMIGIHVHNPAQATMIRDSLREAMKDYPLVAVDAWQDHPLAEVFRTMKGVMLVLQFFMLTVVILVSALSMINTVIRSIDARQAEIGTLRSVGYKNSFVLRLFAWEGAFLGLSGSIFGTTGIWIISKLVDFAHILYHPAVISQKVPLRIAFSSDFNFALSLGLILLAACTGLGVAKLKVSRDIASILRHEG